jgi:hypothetical protein
MNSIQSGKDRYPDAAFSKPLFPKTITMTLDDESLLSAHMDGELDEAQQRLVESSLVSEPRLAEKLRQFHVLRDLVASLPREAPADAIPQVMYRIRSRLWLRTQLARSLGKSAVPQRLARAAGIFCLAAGLLVAVVWSFSQVSRIRDGDGAGREPGTNLASRQESLTTSTTNLEPGTLDKSQPSSLSSIHSEGAPGEVAVEDHSFRRSPGESETRRATGEVESVSDYLDNPNLRRVFRVKDSSDGTAQDRVARVVEQTTRLTFYKLTVPEGMAIDPRHPAGTTVFALVVNAGELESLGKRLRVALPDRVEEADVEPQVVMQLAEIEQVAAFRPAPSGEVVIPRDELAVKHVLRPGAADMPRDLEGQDRPTPEQYLSAPVATRDLPRARRNSDPDSRRVSPRGLAGPEGPNRGQRPDPEPQPAAGKVEGPGQPVVVLVWVSRPGSN